MKKKTKNNKDSTLVDVVIAAAVSAAGAAVASSVDKKNKKKVKDNSKKKSKDFVTKIDDLSQVMNYLNKLLVSSKISANIYVAIGQQACKEYKTFNGRLSMPEGAEKYVDKRVELIDGINRLNQKNKL